MTYFCNSFYFDWIVINHLFILACMKEGKTTDKKLISGLFLMGIVLFISLSFFSRKQYLKTAEEDFDRFYSTEFKGEITDMSASGGKYYFKLNYSSNEYFIQPRPVKEDQKSFYFIDVGDYFYKEAESDTVLIVSGGDSLYFTFKKY